jgi:hypothetical protein
MVANTITRKCAKCKKAIEIDVDDIKDVIYFNKLYYHKDCFVNMAQQKAASKRGKPQMWQDALRNVVKLESETKRMLEHFVARDELNVHLLNNYNITMIPTRFWQIIADLELGKYKGKHCKPVDIRVLCGCWKWGQRKLNEISQYNTSHNKGPTDDNARLMYDLTILIGKIPNYLAYKEKQKAAENEMATTVALNDDIDMSKIGQGKQVKRTDISDISDDIFVE